MREIKFRAWAIKEKYWIHKKMVNGNVQFYVKDVGVELVQYTGLKDKNGVEIYEGDVIQTGDEKYIGVVESKVFGFEINRYRRGIKLAQGIAPYYTGNEVIGNIYENKDLLDG